jgi:hexosaminidase
MEPTKIEISLSDDGENFRTVATKDIPEPNILIVKDIFEHELAFEKQTARWVSVKMTCATDLPKEHVMHGADPFLFVSEIQVF